MNSNSNSLIFNVSLAIVFVVFVTAWLLVKGYQFEAIPIQSGGIERVFSVLCVFFAISLFIERSIEFSISLVRDPGARERESGNKNELSIYRDETKKMTLWISFVVGLFVSAAGVRALGGLLDVPLSSTSQKTFFHFFNIFITAGLLSGGSEGLHHAMEAFTKFMKFQICYAENRIESLSRPKENLAEHRDP